MKIKLEKFEGPLSLLLKLIEKEEMDVTEISLSRIADQFVTFIKSAESIDPDDIADFLVVAAKLLLIKSKALLPFLYPEEEEEIEEFEKQLKMYQEFLNATKKIEEMLGKKKFMFAREFNRKVVVNTNSFSPPKKLTADDLKNIFADIIGRAKPPEKLEEEVLDHKVNIEEKIETIQQMLAKRIEFSFNKVLHNAKSKTEIIVSFLAMLELEKQRNIVIEQGELFSEIFIKKYKKEDEGEVQEQDQD